MPLIRYVGDQPRDESSVTANSSRWWPGEMRRLESGARANALLSARQGWELVTDADGATVQPLTAAQVQAVQFTPIAAADIATTAGTLGESRQISDGPDRGARLIWAVPDGATEPTWCWWLWPQSAYEGA